MVWRFHRDIYEPLDTTGSLTYGGRWNPNGAPVLYTSLTFAGGLLELLAHSIHPRRLPRNHVGSLIEIPDGGGLSVLDPPYLDGWDNPTDYIVGWDWPHPGSAPAVTCVSKFRRLPAHRSNGTS